MNEKLQQVLGTVRGAASQAGSLAVDAAYGAGKWVGDTASSAKQKYRAMVLEGDIEDALQEVGAMLYATHTGKPTDSEVLLAKLQEIDKLRAQLAAARGESVSIPCPICGAENQAGDSYCRTCGEKL